MHHAVPGWANVPLGCKKISARPIQQPCCRLHFFTKPPWRDTHRLISIRNIFHFQPLIQTSTWRISVSVDVPENLLLFVCFQFCLATQFPATVCVCLSVCMFVCFLFGFAKLFPATVCVRPSGEFLTFPTERYVTPEQWISRDFHLTVAFVKRFVQVCSTSLFSYVSREELHKAHRFNLL